ncbi:MAG: NAD-dependent epimerase/dehydratase family protein [Alcaligenaceae bacterium]
MTTTTPSARRKTLIAGATGQIGSSVGMHLMGLGEWGPIGLARTPDPKAPYPMIAVDLTDSLDCQNKLAQLQDVTHVLYAARFDHFGGELESKETNVTMLRNLLDAIEPRSKNLQHLHLVHGTKYYGHTVQKRRTPYREDDACGNFKSFYFEQQQLVQQRQLGQNWSWSISRPHAFCNYRTDEARNMLLVLGLYASILRELGEPLHFPGTPRSFEVKTQFSWLPTLARSAVWMMTEPQCANQAYNIVNGDPLSWSELWPLFAQYFKMAVGQPNSSSFAQFAANKDAIWQSMIKKYDLKKTDLQTLAQWPYGDYVLSLQWDVVSDMSKAQRDGFTETINTPKMFLGGFDYFREHKMIP